MAVGNAVGEDPPAHLVVEVVFEQVGGRVTRGRARRWDRSLDEEEVSASAGGLDVSEVDAPGVQRLPRAAEDVDVHPDLLPEGDVVDPGLDDQPGLGCG